MSNDLDEYTVGTIGYALICRNCRKTMRKHSEMKCLFDATIWDPMNLEEWHAFRAEVETDVFRLAYGGKVPTNSPAYEIVRRGEGIP